jgi:flagellar hook-associated protein 2
MATIQSPGIGSGLDIASLVEKLVAAERAPGDTQLTRRESKATMQISALATLKGALSGFKAALDPLKTEGAFEPHTVSTSDEAILTATANGEAATGRYDIEVIALAKAHQLSSPAFSDGADAVVGTGTLTIAQGSDSFDVVIDSTNNTLEGIRDAINAAADNTGVQATLINEANGTHLVLTANKTGADGAIEITRTGGDVGLDKLVYDPGVLTNMTPLQPAQDAHIKLATYDIYASKNTITDAIDGVTLVLKAETEANTPISINVANDTTLLRERVKAFVTGYNTLNTTISSLRSYDAVTQKGGPLLGDALVRGIEEELRSGLIDPVSGLEGGTYTTLASLGITKQVDGSLKLDEARFAEVLDTDRAAVARVFGSENGVAARLFSGIEARLASGSALETRNKALQADMKRIETDKAALDARMVVIEERYRKQFTALDTLLAGMTTTANFLASSLANLPKPGGND